MYRIVIKREALKELQLLPKKAVAAITNAIEALSANPRPHGYKKLKGDKENMYRIRIGNYRVIYNIDDIVRVVNIRNIGNRKDVYD